MPNKDAKYNNEGWDRFLERVGGVNPVYNGNDRFRDSSLKQSDSHDDMTDILRQFVSKVYSHSSSVELDDLIEKSMSSVKNDKSGDFDKFFGHIICGTELVDRMLENYRDSMDGRIGWYSLDLNGENGEHAVVSINIGDEDFAYVHGESDADLRFAVEKLARDLRYGVLSCYAIEKGRENLLFSLDKNGNETNRNWKDFPESSSEWRDFMGIKFAISDEYDDHVSSSSVSYKRRLPCDGVFDDTDDVTGLDEREASV